jgi:tRNA nucleotidyltransferase (CCA-adding enzyme)
MKHFHIKPTLSHFSNIFTLNGYSCYLVGGALRNYYAGLKPTDYDFATDAGPKDVQRIFKNVIPTGIKHGTVTVLFKGHQFEVTTFRIEGNYSNSRHPDEISFSPSIFEDLKRRDFTINSIAMNLQTGEVLDPHNGIHDLKRRVIRAIGNPVERFNEDGLRLMRACRFTAQLNFCIEMNTFKAVKECKDNLKKVSAERIRDEIIKILGSDKPSIALRIMEETGILNLIIPELSKCRGIIQKGYHNYDVLDHLYYSCDGGPNDDIILRLACLLHDIGKPPTLSLDEDGFPTFYNHEKISKTLAAEIMQKLRFSGKEIKRAVHLISNHMFNYSDEWTDAAVRRFISKVGVESIDDLFRLRAADQFGMTNSKSVSNTLSIFSKRINDILSITNTFKITDLAVSGTDLQNECGIIKGPIIGIILNELLQTVLDDPALNNKESLLKIAGLLGEKYSIN